MTNSIKYKLKSPVNIAEGEVLSDVELREPIVDDMIALDDAEGGSSAQVAMLLSLISGIDYATFRKISSRDALAMKRLADEKWGNVVEDGGKPPS